MIYEIEQTTEFSDWLDGLKNRQAALSIFKRLTRLEAGNFGDSKAVGDGVFELRFFLGSGYRVYYTIRNNTLILLLYGGDKSSQRRDIAKAKKLAQEL